MLLTLSLIVFTLATDSVSLFSPLRVQGAAFRHGFPLAALSCTVTPFLGGHGGAPPEELKLLLRAVSTLVSAWASAFHAS